LTNHAIVSIVDREAAKVRCRSCYHDHTYLREIVPPSKKDLKKMELFNAVLAGSGVSPETEGEADPPSDSQAPAAEPAEAKKTRGRAKKA
jgi:hypothetical protein